MRALCDVIDRKLYREILFLTIIDRDITMRVKSALMRGFHCHVENDILYFPKKIFYVVGEYRDFLFRYRYTASYCRHKILRNIYRKIRRFQIANTKK